MLVDRFAKAGFGGNSYIGCDVSRKEEFEPNNPIHVLFKWE